MDLDQSTVGTTDICLEAGYVFLQQLVYTCCRPKQNESGSEVQSEYLALAWKPVAIFYSDLGVLGADPN